MKWIGSCYTRLRQTWDHAFLRRGCLVLADQCGYSLISFVLGILLARACSRDLYGLFVLGMTFVFFSKVVQRSLVSVPFSVFYSRCPADEQKTYLRNTALQHFLVTALLVALIALGAGLSRLGGVSSGFGGLLPCFLLLIGCSLSADFVRTVLITRFQVLTCLLISAAMQILMLTLLVGLYSLGVLNVDAACLILGLGYAAFALAGASRIKLPGRPSSRRFSEDARRNIEQGRWILSGTMVNYAGLGALPWITLLWWDRQVVATAGVLMTLTGILHPLLEAMVHYLTPTLSAMLQTRDGRQVKSRLGLVLGGLALMGLGLTVCMYSFGDFLICRIYGSAYGGYPWALTLFAAAACLRILNAPLRALITALEQSQFLVKSSSAATVLSLFSAVFLIPAYAVTGIAAVHVLFNLTVFLANCLQTFRKESSGLALTGRILHENPINQQLTKNVRLTGDRILKKTSLGPQQAALLRAAHTLSMQSRTFYVPEVLDYDPEARVITLEYVPDMVPLKQYLQHSENTKEVLSCVGEALAHCHSHLRLAEEDLRDALPPWAGNPADRVVVHGDFNLTNLYYQPDRNRLVILDWETSPALPGPFNRASRYLDLAQFIRSLLLQRDSRAAGLMTFHKNVSVFLSAYQQASGVTLDRTALVRCLKNYNRAVLKKQRRQHKYLSGLHSLLGMPIFQTIQTRPFINRKREEHMNPPADYRTSHTDSEKGALYDHRFRSFRWRRHLWKREQEVLRTILKDFYGGREIHYLDFACGTGRILEFMKDSVTEAVGIDLSESMLARCIAKVPGATIYKGDITQENVLGRRKFNLITAFRFFPNAQPSLREDVLDALAWHLTSDGLLIFNNHRNQSSLLYRLARLFGKKPAAMSGLEVNALVEKVGFEIVKIYSLGALPAHENNNLWMPGWVHDLADWFSRKTGTAHTLCQNNIYVCRKRSVCENWQSEVSTNQNETPLYACV